MVQPATQKITSIKATKLGGCLSVLVEFEKRDSGYALLLDTEDNAATGYRAFNWSEHSGADYMVQAGQLHRHDSAGQPTGGWGWRDPKALEPIAKDGSLEFRIPLSWIQANGRIWLGFMLIDASNNTSSKIPSANAFVALSQAPQKTASIDPKSDRSACRPYVATQVSSSRQPTTISKGMIVPAHLPVASVRSDKWDLLRFYEWPKPALWYGDWQIEAGGMPLFALTPQEYDWLRLVRAAREMSSAGRDLWVVVNGPNSGPLTSSADWQIASHIWGDLREEGGRVFGYVHTCKASGQAPDFIAIDEVMKQIKSWVDNFADLDGVWLDEFNPRYELFDVEGAKFTVPASCESKLMPPSYPNGACLSPVDRGFVLADGCYNPGVQIAPEGGYYHALTSRIRAEYPWLRIIGNAGGRLYSNQLKYAKLVDVLVSYENSFANAQQSGWGLTRQDASVAHEAALFHGTRLEDMPSAIDHVLDYGYTHVYATDQVYGSGSNVWGNVSSHLAQQTTYLIEQH